MTYYSPVQIYSSIASQMLTLEPDNSVYSPPDFCAIIAMHSILSCISYFTGHCSFSFRDNIHLSILFPLSVFHFYMSVTLSEIIFPLSELFTDLS
jgi:hypothetical protein